MDDGQCRTFKIKFEGEGVDDYGGPYRELFQQVFHELQLLNSNNIRQCFLPILMPTPNWSFDGECRERYCFMFDLRNECNFKRELFEFFGQVLGIMIRSKVTVDLSFPSYIWKCFVGETLSEADLASFDQASYEMVQRLSEVHSQFQLLEKHDSDELDRLKTAIADLTWCVRRSDGSVIEINNGGRNRSVDLEDVGEYLTQYMNIRFDENRLAIQCLRKGLFTIIPQSIVGILTHQELMSLVCGAQTVDIDRLMANTEYDDDLSPQDPHIEYFWKALKEFSEDEKSAFLRFVWARSSLPPIGVEFSQKMRILNLANDDCEIQLYKQDSLLPKAHTCFFSINLPKYSSKEVRIFLELLFIEN